MTEERMVNCVKFGKELPGLAKAPRNDELGQRIFDNVSQQGWDMWIEQQTILINHYGLNMVDPDAHDFLSAQMTEYFFGDGAALPEGWVPEGQSGGDKGAPAGGDKGAPGGGGDKGAPSGGGKGAPAPSSK